MRLFSLDNSVCNSFTINNISDILHEIHKKDCNCSYCKGKYKLSYGLNIPKNKSCNSWWIIKYKNKHYLRFTLTFLKYFKRKNKHE
jgi:hypothetical protein